MTFAQAYECRFFADELCLLQPDEVRATFDDDCLRHVSTWVNGGVDIGRTKDVTAIVLSSYRFELITILPYFKICSNAQLNPASSSNITITNIKVKASTATVIAHVAERVGQRTNFSSCQAPLK